MIADYIAKILNDGGLSVKVGDLPSAPDDCTAVIEYSSDINTEYFGGSFDSTISGPVIKVVTRSSTYPQGRDIAESIKTILHRYHDDTLLSVVMVGSPIYLGKGDNKLHEFQVTFKTEIKE